MMNRRELIDYCLSFPDAYEDYPFGDTPDIDGAWTVMRRRSNKKSFALIYERGGLCVNLKCEPMESDFLRSVYSGVTPGYHMNKIHWNTVRPDADVPDELLFKLIAHSYELVAPKRRR